MSVTPLVNEPSELPLPQRQFIDVRTVVIVVAALIGIPGTGVLTSVVGSSAVADEVKGLSVEVERLTAMVAKLDSTVDDIRQDKRAYATSFEVLRERVEDHEARLRVIEKGKR